MRGLSSRPASARPVGINVNYIIYLPEGVVMLADMVVALADVTMYNSIIDMMNLILISMRNELALDRPQPGGL